ncbi:PTS sugar transporter subunit IIC [Lysinibacillus piscis]|uniref:Permease IIC component n=1 Tax=Lysinibacillus piscis TaxID=2518931 RepID=A0ABQ5NM28_9BACI|nr:PTS transporter subunit EIIC [Lysinibacillus sp. KH24]GLC89074.1 permease IIC component [Lysinibacillus sp. KH24]
MSKFSAMSQVIERRILPFANKMGQQRHLAAIRDAFITLLPINLMGGLAAIIKSPPVTESTTNGMLLAWNSFAMANDLLLNWLYAFTLGAMSLYICVGVTHFLCRHYSVNSFIPILFSLVGFFLTVTEPMELGWDGKSLSFSFIDGKGILPALIIAILTTELYQLMKKKNFGKISMPPGVPPSLSDVFASLFPGMILITVYILIFALFRSFDSSFASFIFTQMAPAFKAADSLVFVIFITILIHFLWFFGIHDASLSGVVGPIRDGNLSINASAKIAGEVLPTIFTTPFWVYFVVIGGCGAVLGLAVLLMFSKSKQLKTMGKVGFLPALFGISEPLIFGIPLMLNPIFFIPFIFAATVNAVTTFLLMDWGIIAKTFSMVSWNMPSFLGAFFSTLDWKAPILVIALTILNTLIYYPFLKIYDRQLYNREQEFNAKKVES